MKDQEKNTDFIAYIDKIIAIGEKEHCTDEEYVYFKNNLPNAANNDFLYTLSTKYNVSLRHWTRREIVNFLLGFNPHVYNDKLSEEEKKKSSFISTLIKGIHLIEQKNHGVGSTTSIANIIGALYFDEKGLSEIYNWIAFNGGNYYINQNMTFEKAGKIEIEHRIAEGKKKAELERIHIEALARKKKNSDEHLSKGKKYNISRTKEIAKLRKLDQIKQIKSIAKSIYPLDFYPAEFSEVDENIIVKLSPKELQNLKKKSQRTKKGPWRFLIKIL